MRFFIDEGVPRSVGQYLKKLGHEVIYLDERIAKGSPDTLVAAVAESNDAILIAFDSDFKSLASRHGIGQKRFKRLSLIRFQRCRESRAVERLGKAMSLIEHEWEFCQSSTDQRMFIVIQTDAIRTYR